MSNQELANAYSDFLNLHTLPISQTTYELFLKTLPDKVISEAPWMVESITSYLP